MQLAPRVLTTRDGALVRDAKPMQQRNNIENVLTKVDERTQAQDAAKNGGRQRNRRQNRKGRNSKNGKVDHAVSISEDADSVPATSDPNDTTGIGVVGSMPPKK